MNELIYLVWLHYIWFTHRKLFSIFSDTNISYKYVFENININFLKKYNFTDSQISVILKKYDTVNLEELLSILNNRSIKIITYSDNDYPTNFNELSSPPYFIYLRWSLNIDLEKISLVWSRNISTYWKKVIKKIIPDLTKFFCTVSWWAAWCDTFIHDETIKNNWKTVSVIWTWIDVDYPSYNKGLYNEIVSSWWWIISIFPLKEVWHTYNFPIRNELIASLWIWTVVIEAASKSWTLITANLALDLWKDLFVAPWDIFNNNSLWCNNLIKSWSAKLIMSANDILEEYGFFYNLNNKNPDKLKFDSDLEKNIYILLEKWALSIDKISQNFNYEISLLLQITSEMELKWLIKQDIWWDYTLVV